jgi:hypothetical protein
MLQAVSLLVSLTVLLWTVGLPFLNVAAANVTDVSDTLSDSDRGVVSNHTITFVSPTGVTNGQTIIINFPVGFNLSTSSVDYTDIDVASSSDFTVHSDCTTADQVGASISGQNLTLTFCPGDGGYISPYGTTTIQIGTNATFEETGNQRITNHPVANSYELNINAGPSDSGATRIVILDDVVVTASVDTRFDFTVTGFNATGVNVNGTTTNATSSSTVIPFGLLTANNIKTAAQRLNVTTNASNGFVVTVFQSGNLSSATGADIDSFINGSYLNTPDPWSAPTPVIGSENTYGHWGLTSSDDLNSNEFGTNEWVAASTTPRQVFSATSSADGLAANVGSTTVGYQVQISALQEAADDYSTTLTYIATPTF